MTAYEERKELLQMAREVLQALNAHNKMVHKLINNLISVGDELGAAAVDEMSAKEHITKKNVTYTGRTDASKENITPPPAPGVTVMDHGGGKKRMALPAKLAPGKRACSICRKPGHRKHNCPEADAKYKADRAKKGRKK